MRCPYCSQDVRDEAIVCNHCGRDLDFLRPVLDRLRAVEAELGGVRQSLVALRSTGETPAPGKVRPEQLSPARGAAAVGLYALLVVAITAAAPADLPDYLDAAARIAMLTPPLLLGVWLGISVRGRHGLRYAGVGLLLGVVWFAASVREFRQVELAESVLLLAVCLVWGGLLTVAGGWFGDWIELGQSGPRERGRAAQAIGRILGARQSEEKWERRIELVDDAVKALKPILGLILAILTTVQLYLGTA